MMNLIMIRVTFTEDFLGVSNPRRQYCYCPYFIDGGKFTQETKPLGSFSELPAVTQLLSGGASSGTWICSFPGSRLLISVLWGSSPTYVTNTFSVFSLVCTGLIRDPCRHPSDNHNGLGAVFPFVRNPANPASGCSPHFFSLHART